MFRKCLFSIVCVAASLTGLSQNAMASSTSLLAADSRIAINPPTQPMSGSAMVVITRPGSYYLTGTIVGQAGRNGIEIRVNNVNLNLNGQSLRGMPGSKDAIVLTGSKRNNINVLNGSIHLWGEDAIDLSMAENVRIENITSSHNGGMGIRVGQGVVSKCAVRSCRTGGIQAGPGSVLTDCTVSQNLGVGISAGPGSTIRGCSVESNSDSGIQLTGSGLIIQSTSWANGLDGIDAGPGSNVESCVAVGNAGSGIRAGSGSTVRKNNAAANDGDGIVASSGCTVADNNCADNGPQAAGIRVIGIGPGGRIDSNNVSGNGWGILVEGSTNMIIKNTASGNGINYDFALDNYAGKIIKSKKGQINSPNAWGNFAF